MVEVEITRAFVLGVIVGLVTLFFPAVARILDSAEVVVRALDIFVVSFNVLGIAITVVGGGATLVDVIEPILAYLVELLADYPVGWVFGMIGGGLASFVVDPIRRILRHW